MTQQAKISGLSISQFIRSLIAGSQLTPKPPGAMAEFFRQISAIGNNINQLTKIANTYQRIRQEDVEHIIDMQTRIWRMVKQL